MAPLQLYALTACYPQSPFFPNKSQNYPPFFQKRKHYSTATCKATNNHDHDHDHQPNNKLQLDRRNLLMGLGAAGLGLDPVAMAHPILAPDPTKCGPTIDEEIGLNCCPPLPIKKGTIPEFKLPASIPTVRVRPAAHNVLYNPEYLNKYKTAIQLMKNLDIDDPRNFWRQAQVHCAYCDGAFKQIGYPELEIQVHSSWLFFPFHRFYLYFYERILRKLIKDPTFALPFWNWDSPAGMHMPQPFEQGLSDNPLYDHYREAEHRKSDFLLDYDYQCDIPSTPEEIIKRNLICMRKQMLGSQDLCVFFGQPYRAGDKANPGAGSIERFPHNVVHNWTGDPNWQGEDMGNFYSAGRDPVFYAHHANVDRMWYLWNTKLGCGHFNDPDWLDAEFLFYDEEKVLRRVKVQDCLVTEKLGYVYEDVDIPWQNPQYKPSPRKQKKKTKAQLSAAEVSVNSPKTLVGKVSVEVARPVTSRQSAAEKKEREVTLVVKGIEFPSNQQVRFDVYVNDDADTPSRCEDSEFAGSFVHVPHRHSGNIKTNLNLPITKLLEDLGAEEDSSVVVTLVPRVGKGPITVEISDCSRYD